MGDLLFDCSRIKGLIATMPGGQCANARNLLTIRVMFNTMMFQY